MAMILSLGKQKVLLPRWIVSPLEERFTKGGMSQTMK